MAPTSMMAAPSATMRSAVRSSSSAAVTTDPGSKDPGLTLMAHITATSPPPPRWTPARVARIGVVTKSKYHCRERAEQPNYGVGGAARRGGRAASRAGSGGGGSFLEGPGDQDPVDLFAV